jgi:phage baseplate assembly protein gpV
MSEALRANRIQENNKMGATNTPAVYTQEKPVEYGEDIYFKRFMKDASMKYDRATKTLYLDVQHVVITGDLTTGGDTVADGISLDHHTHGDPQGGSTGGPQ